MQVCKMYKRVIRQFRKHHSNEEEDGVEIFPTPLFLLSICKLVKLKMAHIQFNTKVLCSESLSE